MTISANIARFLKPTQTEWGWSKWATLERCPREFSLGYLHHIRPREVSRALQIGTAMHRGLAAAYWRTMNATREATLDPTFCRSVINAGKEGADIKLEAIRLVVEHEKYWAQNDEGFDRVIAVEKFAEKDFAAVEKSQGVPFTTRYDLVAMKGKQPYIIDHKSSSRPGDSLQEWGLAGQFIGQVAVWPGKGTPAVMINKIIKTNPVRFDRTVVPFTKAMVERWKKDLALLSADLARYAKTKYWPRKYSSCQRRYGQCDYAPLCREGSSRRSDFYVPKGVDLEEVLK
jgi:hypothetical protein